jgi:hypothetical protein
MVGLGLLAMQSSIVVRVSSQIQEAVIETFIPLSYSKGVSNGSRLAPIGGELPVYLEILLRLFMVAAFIRIIDSSGRDFSVIAQIRSHIYLRRFIEFRIRSEPGFSRGF